MKTYPYLIGIVLVLGIGGYFYFNQSAPTDQAPAATVSTSPVLHLAGKDISLLVSDTEEKREIGLGNHTSLPENEAMLFVFDTPDMYEFWMKDMKFPIDIIWLDSSFTVVHIAPNVSPDTYPDETFLPEKEALYVLETNANFASKNSITLGTKLNIDLKK